MRHNSPRIAITLGDPAGIGPEILLGALNKLEGTSIKLVVIGTKDYLGDYYPSLLERLYPIGHIKEGYKSTNHLLLDIPTDLTQTHPGKPSMQSGKASIQYIDTAITLWKEDHIDAIVTGPVSKELIHNTGKDFVGHTEYFANAIGEDSPYMLMYSSEYRVLLATTHLSLDSVCSTVTESRLVKVIETAFSLFKEVDEGPVRLAVAGMDPHCGDGGAIGSFDKEVTIPAIKRCQAQGIPVEGPFAADTLFRPLTWKGYSCCIAQYHDQGLIPFKVLAFDTGVNVTLGLSLIRTSVDHGTAFDIAGTGTVSWESMYQAIDLASHLIHLKNNL